MMAHVERQDGYTRPTSRSSLIFLFFLVALVQVCLLPSVNAVPASDNVPLLHVERVGVPYPSWTSPVNGKLVETERNSNPNLTRASHLAPRFHRMLRYGQDLAAKTQTALFIAGRTQDDEELERPGASIVSALNPRNGDIVWRSIRNATDPVHAMYLASDVMLTLSGLDHTRVSLLHALSGTFLWSSVTPVASNAANTGLLDAAFIPPAYLQPAGSASVPALAPDAIVMDRSGAVSRFAGVNGALVWSHEPLAVRHEGSGDDGQHHQTLIPLKLHSDKKHTIIASLVPHQSRSRIFSTSQMYSLRITVLLASNGERVASFDVPNSSVEMTNVLSEQDTTSNVAIVGRDAEAGSDRPPHVVWLQKDGTVKSLAIPLPTEPKEVHVDTASIHSLKPKTASRFNALIEIAVLRNRGLLMARTDNARAEVLRISKKEKRITSFWEMEEEAIDSVYTGGLDRQARPYINRVFFGRSQHLINFHTLWADSYDEQGQVTGASFQWDHDLHGDVLAAPFEVSPSSEFQLIWRSAFVTRSSSIRMLQDERHQWMREEGLSHTTASIMVDLPESKVATGHASTDARSIVEGEGIMHRLQRHAIALQSLPQWTFETILHLAAEIPNLSLESFGIIPPASNPLRVLPPGVPPLAPASDAIKNGVHTAKAVGNGAAPLRGVGAQKVGAKAARAMPPGVPQPNTRGTRKPKEEEAPPPPASAGPREANATVTEALVRDAFGFRKLIVATSKSGKIYAIDSKTGTYVWEKSLFGFGQGEGASVPTVDVKMLALVRPLAGSGADISTPASANTSVVHATSSTAQLDYDGLLTVVATVHDEGAVFTRMWEIEPLTGRFPGGADAQTGIALFPEEAKDTFLLPIEDEKSGQIAAVAISQQDKIMIWPTTTSIQQRFLELGSNFFYSVKERSASHGRELLVGYTPVSTASGLQGQKAWQLPIPADETIISVTRPNQDPVASQGKVLGDRETLYKYLNPHLALVLTKSETRRSGSVYIVDGITGKIVHQSLLTEGNLVLASDVGEGAQDPIAVFTENWASIVFSVEIRADDLQARYKGAHRQTRLISIELYDAQAGTEETWKWRGVFSSFSSKAASSKAGANVTSTEPVQTITQLFVVPYGVRGMAATRTKLGISSKALVLATEHNRLQVLPRRMLDPRRPIGRKPTNQEMEEGLITYDPVLLDTGKFLLGGRTVPLPRRVRTKASHLESTSVVFVDQSLDYFVTTVAPSGSFDLLSASFNKLQLLATMLILSIGLFVTKPMVASKMLNLRW